MTQVVGERFELLREAGAGGMGVVWEARDRTSGERVAVKVLGERVHEERFLREAELLAGLRHDAIVRYVAHGAGWLAMEWLDGEDLGARLERGALSIEDAIALGARVVEAVAIAHERGIVHRDLKPTNVFLVGGDVRSAKVLDFGLAREVKSDNRPLTQVGAVMGSIGYLSPEQARGSANVDARSDVFSLGCILFECVTGKAAFSGAHAVAILAKLLVEDAARIRELRPDAPRALDELVARMLDRNPERRQLDASIVLAELDRLGASKSIAPRSTMKPASLGRDEQRVMSVILVGGREDAPGESSSSFAGATMFALRDDDARDAVASAIAPYEATLDVAAEGTLVVTLRGDGAATDQAARAARCALVLRAKCPGTAIALALGKGVAEGITASGEVIERAAALLSSAIADDADAVHVEASVAPLLDARFVVAPGNGAMLLHAERSAFESARIVLGRVTPFVGRARELAMIENAFASSVAESQASTIVVLGEAGSGKSRLREEAVRAAKRRDPSAVVWIVQGDTLRAQTPFAPIAMLVRSIVGATDPNADARGALVARVGAQVACFLGEMIGCPFDDAASPQLRVARESKQLMGDQITRAWVAFASAELARRPVLVVLEDMHWIDAGSLKLVDAMLGASRDAPLVVLAFGRPEAQGAAALWAEHGLQTIRLAPLAPRAAEKLAREALAENADDALVARLVERAAGNPFVLEELVRAHAERPESGDALPDGVLALVQARLLALDPSHRRVLRAASIFGRTAREEGIARLLGDDDAIELVRLSLRVLVQREVLEAVRDDASLFRFRHDLVRDAAYAMLTDDDRATGHALAAAWLEAAGETDAALLATHYDLGGDRAVAAGWYARAAEQALDGSDLEIVHQRVACALERGVTGELRGRALMARALARRWTGDCALGLIDARESIAGFAPGTDTWYAAIVQACALGDAVSAHAAVAELYDLAMTATPENARAHGTRVRVLGEVASALYHAGDATAGDALVSRIEREVLEHMSEPSVALTLYLMRGMHAAYAGDSSSELDRWVEIDQCYAAMGDRRLGAMAAVNIGYCSMMLGAYEEAERALRDAVERSTAMRAERAEAAARHNLGMVLAYRGDFANAEAEETAALRSFEAAHHDRLTAACLLYLAMILEMAGHLERAEDVARSAVAAAESVPPVQPRAVAVLARIVLGRGRLHEADELSGQAMRSIATSRIEGGEAYIRLVRIESLLALGRRDEARSVMREAKDVLLATAAKIRDDGHRRCFLDGVPENARTLALSAEHLRP